MFAQAITNQPTIASNATAGVEPVPKRQSDAGEIESEAASGTYRRDRGLRMDPARRAGCADRIAVAFSAMPLLTKHDPQPWRRRIRALA